MFKLMGKEINAILGAQTTLICPMIKASFKHLNFCYHMVLILLVLFGY